MTGIIKRRKTTEFAQIQNKVLQSLDGLIAIGLIAHLMSMPADWKIRKTHLYMKFSRSQVTKGIAELEMKKYWVHLVYRDGSKNLHSYHVSDAVFSDEEVKEIIEDIIKAGHKITSISEPFLHLLTEQNNQKKEEIQESSTVDFQQLKMNSSKSTVENEQLLNKDKQINKKQIKRKQRNLVNLQADPFQSIDVEEFRTSLTTACHQHYSEYASGRWSKKAWNTLIGAFVEETIASNRYKHIPVSKIENYAYSAIKNMAHSFDRKYQRKSMHRRIPTRPVPFYDWVSGPSETDD